MPKPAPKKVVPVGEPINWSEADIARLADVTEEDKHSAKAFWRAKAKGRAKRLLDAKKAK